MKILILSTLVLALLVPPHVAACNPGQAPEPLRAELNMPRAELTACVANAVTGITTSNEQSFVALGRSLTTSPWMPEDQQKKAGHVLAFTVTLTDTYMKSRGDDEAMMFVTGTSLEEANTVLNQMLQTTSVRGGPDQPKKSPSGNGQTVRYFPLKDGKLAIFTSADFLWAVIFDPATATKLYEVRVVMGG